MKAGIARSSSISRLKGLIDRSDHCDVKIAVGSMTIAEALRNMFRMPR